MVSNKCWQCCSDGRVVYCAMMGCVDLRLRRLYMGCVDMVELCSCGRVVSMWCGCVVVAVRLCIKLLWGCD